MAIVKRLSTRCQEEGELNSLDIDMDQIFISWSNVINFFRFSNRTVVTSYFDPDKYHRREF